MRTDLATLERLLERSPGGRRNGLVFHFLQVLRDLAAVFVLPPLLCADPARAALYVMNSYRFAQTPPAPTIPRAIC